MFSKMTTADKVKTVVGVLVAAGVTFGFLDVGQASEVNNAIATVIAAYLALSVKPLGPATE